MEPTDEVGLPEVIQCLSGKADEATRARVRGLIEAWEAGGGPARTSPDRRSGARGGEAAARPSTGRWIRRRLRSRRLRWGAAIALMAGLAVPPTARMLRRDADEGGDVAGIRLLTPGQYEEPASSHTALLTVGGIGRPDEPRRGGGREGELIKWLALERMPAMRRVRGETSKLWDLDLMGSIEAWASRKRSSNSGSGQSLPPATGVSASRLLSAGPMGSSVGLNASNGPSPLEANPYSDRPSDRAMPDLGNYSYHVSPSGISPPHDERTAAEWERTVLRPALDRLRPILLDALDDADAEVRYASIRVLDALEPHPTEAVAPLAKLASQEREDSVRRAALLALSRFDPSELRDSRLEPILHARPSVKEEAMSILGDRAPITFLARAFEDPSERVQWASYEAIGQRVDREGRLVLNACSSALDREPDDPAILMARGQAYGALGRWREAIRDHRRAVSHRPRDPALRSMYAVANFVGGDPEAYRRARDKLLDLLGTSRHPKTAELVSLASVLTPPTDRGISLLADRISRDTFRDAPGLYGAVLYRAGDHDKAFRELKISEAERGGDEFVHVFLAMAHTQRGEIGEARRWLRIRLGRFGSPAARPRGSWLPFPRDWRERLLRKLRSEAELLINDRAFPRDPFVPG